MPRAVHLLAVSCLSLVLAGCIGTGRQIGWGQAPERPAIVVNAPVAIVRDVIIDSARQRGSAVQPVGDGLVLQRPLPSSSPEVMAACGPHRPGRNVRVVLRAVAQGAAQTRLSEDRFIVDGASICPLPIAGDDLRQSNDALNRIRVTAEAVQARIRTAERM